MKKLGKVETITLFKIIDVNFIHTLKQYCVSSFAVCALLFLIPASAKPVINGCGPAMAELYLLAPDKIKALDIDFTSACNLHDLCYSNAVANYLKDEEGLSRYDFKTNTEQRIYCDDKFQKAMDKQCKSLPIVEKAFCHSLAISYFSAVVLMGATAFKKDPNLNEKSLKDKALSVLDKTNHSLNALFLSDDKKNNHSEWFKYLNEDGD